MTDGLFVREQKPYRYAGSENLAISFLPPADRLGHCYPETTFFRNADVMCVDVQSCYNI